jgi:hypothetical protein
MNKFFKRILKTKKAFQGILDLNLNQYRCPRCFNTLEAQVRFGTNVLARHKSSDYYWQRHVSPLASNLINIFYNIKIDDLKDIYSRKNIYSRMRVKIFDNHDVLRKQKYIDSTVKSFLFCQKCKYCREVSIFANEPNAQLIKKILS